MFTGDSEIDQLFKTFKKLGTPTEEEWPLLPSLPDYAATFPKFRRMVRSIHAARVNTWFLRNTVICISYFAGLAKHCTRAEWGRSGFVVSHAGI
jgi:hypothetical protein